MTKLKLGQIVNTISLLAQLSTTKLPIKVSYAVAKNVNKLEKELDFFNIEKNKMMDKYCEKNDDGTLKISEEGNAKILDKHLDDWNKEYNELLDIDIDIDIHKVQISKLDDAIQFTPNDLLKIEFMLED